MTTNKILKITNLINMKTRIFSIIAALVVVFGVTKSTYAATANNTTVTVLTDISAINKIEVRGNVELFISDGNADQVKVYNKYYSESALVQSANGVLRITSYNTEKLVVWVTAADLRSVSAYDNAELRTYGDVSKIEFDVDLYNNATAKLDFNAISAKVNVNDQAKADLSGTADELSLSHNYASSVNKYNFSATKFTEKKINFPAEANDDMVGI